MNVASSCSSGSSPMMRVARWGVLMNVLNENRQIAPIKKKIITKMARFVFGEMLKYLTA